MTDKRILFDHFEFPVIKGLDYLCNEGRPVTDFLFVNEPHDEFSMYFENDFPIFKIPESNDCSYSLHEIKCPGRRIQFFCPEDRKDFGTEVWYFYMELFDAQGIAHGLPGQVRVDTNNPSIRTAKGKPPFVEILETVKLNENYA